MKRSRTKSVGTTGNAGANPFPDRLDSSPFEDNGTLRFLSGLGERWSLVNFPLPISISRDSLIMVAGRKARGGGRKPSFPRFEARDFSSPREESGARETLLVDLFSGREKNGDLCRRD